MMNAMKSLALAALCTALTADTAFAHIGHGDQSGLSQGLMHPIGGLDHLLAMVTVGFIAARMGGRTLWLMPLAFVTMMTFGGLLGFSGFALPYVEQGIGLSVVAFGLLVALGLRLPIFPALAIVGTFAIFHGHAHGTELPTGSAPLAFALGFVSTTSLLHVAGICLGQIIARIRSSPWAALWAQPSPLPAWRSPRNE